jgi:hypothetical protein
MNIVPLTLDNIPYACELARELHGIGTFGRDGPPFDWDFCIGSLIWAEKDPNTYFRMAVVDGEYVGAVTGKVTQFYFSPRLLGIEDAWYVREGTPKRASVGIALMRGFVSWCLDTRGAVLVQSGDVAGIRTVGVDALYRHMGFTRFGTIYKYSRDVGEA